MSKNLYNPGTLNEQSNMNIRSYNDKRTSLNYPKISIVTPSFNQGQFLEECIDSILSQNYPNLEYIIIDGGSNDGSVEIIKKYEKYLTYWQSKPDGGQYDAIDQGFRRTTGEIMAWLNSDDKYHPDSLFKVADIFEKYYDVEWITGRPTSWNKDGQIINVGWLPSWCRENFIQPGPKKYYIQQESTFWKRTLWQKSGEKLKTDLKFAGDFELWLRFFRYAQLYTVDIVLAGFRHHPNQKTKLFKEKYNREAELLINQEIAYVKNNALVYMPPAPEPISNRDNFKVTIATNISPKNIDRQSEAIKSWIKLGFNVVSINYAEEIEVLQPSFPDIKFVQAKRDGRQTFGKPVIYLDDFLEYLKNADSEVCGIVNSDIYLLGNEGISSSIKKYTMDSIVYGSRIDVDSLKILEGDVYEAGFDFFFFDKSLTWYFPESDFCMGMPCWDYWMPLVATLEGLQIKKLISPFAYHLKKLCKCNAEHFDFLAKRFLGYLQKRIDENFNSDFEDYPQALLTKIIAAYHHLDLIKNNREDSDNLSIEVIFPCIIDFLELRSSKLHYADNELTYKQNALVPSQKKKDIFVHEAKYTIHDTDYQQTEPCLSIVLCTKDRAQMLDEMLTSLENAANRISYEIIVVSGDSSDNTSDVLQKHDVSQIYNEAEHLGAAKHSWSQLYNFGFSKARGKWAMYASDDIIFGKDCISKALEVLNKQSDDIAGGIFFYKNLFPTNHQWADFGIDFTYGQKFLMNYGLLRLDYFRQVHGFDEAYRFYCADSDLCLKLYEKAKQIIPLPGCLVTHNNILDRRKKENLQASNADIELLLKRWRHFVPIQLPNPRRLMWQQNLSEKSNVKKNIVGLIFSKDRAMQLQATLDSFLLHCADSNQIKLHVLYKTTNQLHQRQYDSLKEKYNNALFIEESNFKQQVSTTIDKYDYVLFLVDDNLFVKDFRLIDIADYLQKNTDAIGFSLRLGKNTNYCYPRNKKQSLPAFRQIDTGILKFNWTQAEFDFAYPLELSSSFYRTSDVLALLDKLEFNNPNVLESQMATNACEFAEYKPALLCCEYSVTFCNPVNKVQSVWNNRSSNNKIYSAAVLAEMFDDRIRIDVERYSDFVPNACHQETQLYFKQISDQPNENTRPRFSIVMANYNHAEYIGQAVESVLNQTFKDWELIIVDDSSMDNSLQIISQYQNDERIKLIKHKNNCGYTASLKTAIANARSEYFGILDSDDYLLPQAVETMYEHHTRFPDCGLIYSQFAYCDENLNQKRVGFCAQIQPGKSTLDAQVVSHFKTFKIHDYFKTSGYDENILYAEDIDIIHKMEEVTRLKFVDKCLYLYRQLPNSISHSKNKINISIMSMVKARINALHKRCADSASADLTSYELLFRQAIKEARANYHDVEQYFILMRMLYEKRLLIDFELPPFIETRDLDDKLLWMAVNVTIKFDELFEFLNNQKNLQTQPIVSVYMVTYNSQKYIAQAIDSVLAQTFKNFELLIVDDGSTDETAGIISSYSDQRIRYIYKEHKNFASGMNRAINEVKGKYILGVDSDDFIAPDYIEKMVTFAENHPEADYFYPAKFVLTDEYANPTGTEWDYLVFSDNRLLPAFLFENCFGPIPNPGSLKRKSLFDRVGLYKEVDTVEDFVFLCETALNINFKRVDLHSTYFYRRLPSSNSFKLKARNRIMAQALNDMVSIYPPELLYPQIADISDEFLKKQKYIEYLMKTFYKHADGPMTRFSEFFRRFADDYKQKLSETTELEHKTAGVNEL